MEDVLDRLVVKIHTVAFIINLMTQSFSMTSLKAGDWVCRSAVRECVSGQFDAHLFPINLQGRLEKGLKMSGCAWSASREEMPSLGEVEGGGEGEGR